MTTVCRAEQLFSLDMLVDHLAGFQPPQGAHDPAGDWQHSYRLYSVADVDGGFGGRHGSVVVTRTRREGGRCSLHVAQQRLALGRFATRLTADITARDQRLPMPMEWSWQSEIVDAQGKIQGEAQFQRTAVLREGLVDIAGRKRRLAARGPITINWLLFEAVGRLPHEAFPPLRFTLVDNFDQLKPGHWLDYANSVTVALGASRSPAVNAAAAPGRPVALHVYRHFGQGILPWVYWVDDQGRLLIASSGIEAYILDSFCKGH